MAILSALLLLLLAIQLASSCSISGPSDWPNLFHSAQGEDLCSGVESAWCFQFKLVADGTSVLEATGCAGWLLEVARNAPSDLREELALAAEICNADPNGVHNLTNPNFTMVIQCSPAEEDKITTTINPYNKSVSTTSLTTTTDKPQLCPVSESGGSFSAEKGREICENSIIDWCFDLEITSSFGHEIAASGCSGWLAEISEDENLPSLERNFLKTSFLVCNQNYSAVQEGKPNAWNYRIICTSAQTNNKTTTTTTVTASTTGTGSPDTTDQRTSTMEPSSEMTTSYPGRKANVCPVEGKKYGLFKETEGKEICKGSTADWCFHYKAKYILSEYTASGCSRWLGVVSERDGSGEFLKEAFIHCTLNNSAVFERKAWRWSYKMTCRPAMAPFTTATTSTTTTTTTTTTPTTTTTTTTPTTTTTTTTTPMTTTTTATPTTTTTTTTTPMTTTTTATPTTTTTTTTLTTTTTTTTPTTTTTTPTTTTTTTTPMTTTTTTTLTTTTTTMSHTTSGTETTGTTPGTKQTTSTAHRETTTHPNSAKNYGVHQELLSAMLFILFAYA